MKILYDSVKNSAYLQVEGKCPCCGGVEYSRLRRNKGKFHQYEYTCKKCAGVWLGNILDDEDNVALQRNGKPYGYQIISDSRKIRAIQMREERCPCCKLGSSAVYISALTQLYSPTHQYKYQCRCGAVWLGDVYDENYNFVKTS